MDIDFKYFSRQESGRIEYYPLALALIKKERIIIDARFLPVLEAAERGDFFAQLEMQEAFATGTQGIPKHYMLARKYTDQILEFNRGKVKPEIEGLKNSAILELQEGNKTATKQNLVEAIKLMVNQIPPENWDWEIPDMLYQLEAVEDEEN